MVTSLEFLEAEPVDLDEIFCIKFLQAESGVFEHDKPGRCAECGHCSKCTENED